MSYTLGSMTLSKDITGEASGRSIRVRSTPCASRSVLPEWELRVHVGSDTKIDTNILHLTPCICLVGLMKKGLKRQGRVAR